MPVPVAQFQQTSGISDIISREMLVNPRQKYMKRNSLFQAFQVFCNLLEFVNKQKETF